MIFEVNKRLCLLGPTLTANSFGSDVWSHFASEFLRVLPGKLRKGQNTESIQRLFIDGTDAMDFGQGISNLGCLCLLVIPVVMVATILLCSVHNYAD